MKINGEQVHFDPGVTMGAEFILQPHAFLARSVQEPDICGCGQAITAEIHQPPLPMGICTTCTRSEEIDATGVCLRHNLLAYPTS